MESSTTAPTPEIKGETIKLNITFKKQSFPLQCGTENLLSELRTLVASITGVQPGLQKLMYKGLLKDDTKTLKDLNLKDGTKIMLIGSTINEVMATASVPQTSMENEEKNEEEQSRESLSEQLPHKKIIAKGLPEGAIPGIKNKHEALPNTPLHDILNNTGQKVRLTFKVWSQELWIQSSSSTQKIPFSSVRNVTSEPIKGHEEYHLMSLQLGSSERNKYYLYWVPSQYTRAIKNTLAPEFLSF